MTLSQFAPIYAVLSAQMRNQDVDTPIVKAYFKVLQDLEPEFVGMAAERFANGASLNSDGQAWFPKAPEWRSMAKRIEVDREAELRGRIRKLPQPLCDACSDTGWRNAAPDEKPYAVSACECRELRRLEVLGRRPMPQLSSGGAA